MPRHNGIKHLAYQQFSRVGQATTFDSRGKKSISYTLSAPVYRQLTGESLGKLAITGVYALIENWATGQ